MKETRGKDIHSAQLFKMHEQSLLRQVSALLNAAEKAGHSNVFIPSRQLKLLYDLARVPYKGGFSVEASSVSVIALRRLLHQIKIVAAKRTREM